MRKWTWRVKRWLGQSDERLRSRVWGKPFSVSMWMKRNIGNIESHPWEGGQSEGMKQRWGAEEGKQPQRKDIGWAYLRSGFKNTRPKSRSVKWSGLLPPTCTVDELVEMPDILRSEMLQLVTHRLWCSWRRICSYPQSWRRAESWAGEEERRRRRGRRLAVRREESSRQAKAVHRAAEWEQVIPLQLLPSSPLEEQLAILSEGSASLRQPPGSGRVLA